MREWWRIEMHKVHPTNSFPALHCVFLGVYQHLFLGLNVDVYCVYVSRHVWLACVSVSEWMLVFLC